MVHDKRRNAKRMRNLRCKSADSGVSCTLNKNILQQDVVQSSRSELNGTGVSMSSLPVCIPRTKTIDDFVCSLTNLLPKNPFYPTNSIPRHHQTTTNCDVSISSQQAEKSVGLDEEDLDFEPEFEDELTDDTEKQSPLHINSDASTVKLFYSDGRDDSISNASIENCSTISIGHRRDMLPIPQSDAEDGRQNEYFPLTFSSTTRTLLDSSSDDTSIGSENDNNTTSVSDGDLSRDQNISYSGDQDNEDNESMYDVSQEQEEILLNSSEDSTAEDEEPYKDRALTDTYHPKDTVNEDEELHLEAGPVVACHFGNARITLPTFFKNTHVDALKPKSNDLKRATSTAKSYKRHTKKKKWDIPYIPEVPPTCLFLEDIGFVAESSSDIDDDRDSNSVKSVPQLVVICNDKNKLVCQSINREMPRANLEVPKNEDNLFKLPLPPPKRPPTRPKMMVYDSKDSGKIQIKISYSKDAGLVQHQENPFDTNRSDFTSSPQNFNDGSNSDRFDNTEDDGISIFAPSLGVDNNEDTSDLSQGDSRKSSLFDIGRLTMKKNLEPVENFSYNEERIHNWIQNVEPEPVPPPPPPPTETEEATQLQLKKSTLTVMAPTIAKGNNRVYFGDIPSVFSGICYYHFFNGVCVRKCNMTHYISRNKFTHKFKHSHPETISKAYDVALAFKNFFKEIYPCFISAFASFKMHKKLIAAIEDIFKMDCINKLEALELIVDGLQKCDLSFLETIEVISFNFGFKQYPELGDILLDLITRKNNISENWDVIKRIGTARGQIAPEIVKRILIRVTSIYPLDKPLCLEIYKVIIKNEMTDLSQIDEKHLAPFHTLAGFRDTSDIASRQPVRLPPDPPIVHPLTIPHTKELLAAHIDNSLMKEREWYENAVEGRTVMVSARPEVYIDNYVNSFDYDARRNMTNYSNFHHSSDSDDRYFTPIATQETFQTADPALKHDGFRKVFMGGGMFSAASSSKSNESVERTTASPNSALRFEPPPPSEVSQYVPEIIRKCEDRNELITPKNILPTFQPSQNLSSFRYQDTDATLTPARPIFGSLRYRSDFKLDKSLHNLLPDSVEHVGIDERDIAKLDSVIKSKNGLEFYKLLDKYKSPATLQSFITMTMAHLKSCSALYEIFIGLVESLEMMKPDYTNEKLIKGVLEVVTMNLLFEFERKCFWAKAAKLLEKFCDWDSLISSQLFQIFATRRVTTMGRYIFLAKIFAKSLNFHYTYEILQCPGLHLLDSCDQWPYFFNAQADLEQRNTVLRDFFQNGYRYNIVNVSDMYRRIYRYGVIQGFDVHSMFNPMLIKIMNDCQISMLKHFHPDIDIYYKVMDKNVLRAFTVLLSNQLSQEALYKLYELCCERHIYIYFQGGESNVTVRNNMLDPELQLILDYYFHKISSTRRLPAGNVTINIKLLESPVCSPKILQKCLRSINEINESVKRILRDNFNIFIMNATNVKLTDIEIKLQQIEDWLRAKDKYCHQGFW